MKTTAFILGIYSALSLSSHACPPPPDHRSADGGWELMGSPLGTPIATVSIPGGTNLLAYYVTLETSSSSTYYGVVYEEFLNGSTVHKDMLDCYWRDWDGTFKPWIDLALSSNGTPALVYQNETCDLWFAQLNSATAGWEKELVQLAATNGSWLGLAYDSENRAVIIHWDADSRNLGYWQRDATNTWSQQAIATNTSQLSALAVIQVSSGGFEVVGADNQANQIRIYSASNSAWNEETISIGTNLINRLVVPRTVTKSWRTLLYLDNLAMIHALYCPTSGASWTECNSSAFVGTLSRNGGVIVQDSLLTGYFADGANVVSFTPAKASLVSWRVASNSCGVGGCTYSWHYVGLDTAILDSGCDTASMLFRTVDGNKAVGAYHSEIQWTTVGSAEGPQPSIPKHVDWTWAYHDDDDGYDDRRTEIVPSTDNTFIPTRPVLENQGFRIYFLTDWNFAGDYKGNAWIRWWNGTNEAWFPTFRISIFDNDLINFHGQDTVCDSAWISIWGADIWASSTRPGTNYYAIQLTSPNLSPADWDYLLCTGSSTNGRGHNNVNQALSEEADYVGHDWSIYIGPDADGDAMDDNWEVEYFGAITNGWPEEDLDQDGSNNLLEYRQGTRPDDPESRLSVWLSDTHDHFCWNTEELYRYRVQSTTNLLDGAWQDIGTQSITAPSGSVNGVVSTPIPDMVSNGFFRVRLAP